ncbi:MAG: SgcJ/EcaC family oxidoreductase [Propionicimonas sp.]
MWSEADDANLPPTPTAGKKARKKASGKRTGKQVATLLGGGAKLPLPAGPSAIASPLDLIVAFVRAWDAGDADALAALFVDDADFINVVGLWWTSSLSIRRAHAWGFEKIFPNSTLTLEKLSQRLLGDDVAVVHARWRIDGQVDPHGDPAESRRGVFSAVVTRLPEGGWLCVSAHNTDIAPAADTNLSVGGVITPTSYLQAPSD